MEKWESVHLQFQCIHVMLLKKKEFPMGHRFKCEDISFAFMLMVSSVLIMMGWLGWIIRRTDVTDVHPENNILVLSGFLRRDTSGSFTHCQDIFFFFADSFSILSLICNHKTDQKDFIVSWCFFYFLLNMIICFSQRPLWNWRRTECVLWPWLHYCH